MDGWGNILTGLGNPAKDSNESTTFSARKPRDQYEIDRLYEQDDVFPLVIDKIPEHGTRRFIRVTGAMDERGRPDKDFSRQVGEALELVDAQSKVYDIWRLHRLHGGALGLLGADDGQTPDKALDLERIKSVKYINVVSRHEVSVAEVNADPFSENYRQPEFYKIKGSGIETIANNISRANGRGSVINLYGLDAKRTNLIHYTRVLRLPRHLAASDTSKCVKEGWDNAVIERVWEPLRQFGSLFGYLEAQFPTLSQGVLKMKGLAEISAIKGADSKLMTRLNILQLARSMFNMVLIDDTESFETRTTAAMGSEAIVRVMDRLAAACEMPLSILFGQPPTGLSTDDESGRRAFYDSVANKQRRLLRKMLTRLITILIKAKEGPLEGKEPHNWNFDFLPLEEPNDKDRADTEFVRVQAEEKQVMMGVLTPQEVRSRLANDPQCPYQLDVANDEAVDDLDDVDETELTPEEIAALRPEGKTPTTNSIEKAADTALNGAQVEAAKGIVTDVAGRILPRDTGVAMLIEFFNIDPARAQRILGSVGKTFFNTADQTATTAPETTPPFENPTKTSSKFDGAASK